jgi:L,D-transpeptidase ErfK/SrfK
MSRMRRSLWLLPLALAANAASAAEFWIQPDDEVFGEVQEISARYEDTFVSLARQYNVGYEELRRANPGIDPWLPGEGTKIVVPNRFVLPRAPHRGIIVNVAELRLYYFPADSGPLPEGTPPGSRLVITHPISIGKMDWSTPLGTTSVTGRVANPSWTPPQSIRAEHAARNDILPRVVPPGPDNPLGKHALRLGLPGYLIHGTNKPEGVGMRITHGCIRMFPEDIEALYKSVPAGTPVTIVNQPYKLGWTSDGLYLEAHLPMANSADGAEEIDEPSVTIHAAEALPVLPEGSLTELTRAYVAATESRSANVRWDFAETVMQSARGVPEFISAAAVPLPAHEAFAAEPEVGATATP